MIIGRGDIAKEIKDSEGFIFYANGCSNRLPFTEETKQKEIHELIKINKEVKNAIFVYISTLSIYYSDSHYTRFKLWMEDLIRKMNDNYCILRIGNITWGDNPNTIINFLKAKIKNNESYEVRDEYRYLIDKDEFHHWMGLLPKSGRHQMNITGTRYKIQTIVDMIKNGQL